MTVTGQKLGESILITLHNCEFIVHILFAVVFNTCEPTPVSLHFFKYIFNDYVMIIV